MKRKGLIVSLFAICLLALVFPTHAAAANPILVITSTSNPFTGFVPEILHTEGFNELDTADISTVTSTTLAGYDLVVLGDMTLTATQASTITTWVNGGGNLIALHPDHQLAGLLGLTASSSQLSDAYVLMTTASGPGVGLVGQTIQFHGPADLYTVNGATTYATLYSSSSTATSNPAVTLATAGSGQAAAFTYDLARSVVYTREGNPAWTGQARDSANAPPIRSYNLWYGGSVADYIDWNKIQIPQADEQQRLLANLILQMNSGKKPLPRFWYLPSGFKAAVVMTGDDHGSYYGSSATANRFSDFIAASPANCSLANWQCVRGTAYLFPKVIATNSLTNTQIANYIAQGFEVGVHVDSATDCQDWTTTQLDAQYTTFLSSLASQYPAIPAPQTHRMHCVSWSDYDSQPTIELKHGIRFDTTHYYWPASWINDRPGLLTGSGMPMRYTDRNGNVINVYQAATQMTDESGQSYPLHINTLLDNALSGTAYYGVFTANMHNDATDYPGPGAAYIVASAQARGVPIVTSLQMLQWLDGRNGSSFNSLAWSGNVLSFSVTVGTNANNLQAMLPTNFGSLGLNSLLLSGSPVTYQFKTVKGVQYAVFSASAGSYQATYGGAPLFSVSGAITPGPLGAGTTVTATGPVTVSATADNYGNYSLNGLPSGTYTITPAKTGLTFNPASQSVAVAGANVAAVNFAMVQTCPCSLWMNAVAPGTANSGDNSAIEVGVRFKSDVAGNITGVRFYKSSSNTGTHTGTLWSNTGTKLGTATFSGETASGWQQVNFATPVAITANTVYVASYHTTTGDYADDAGYFASSSFDNPPLHAVLDGSGGANGVYKYGSSAFPNSTYNSDNYWVDVVFSPSNATYSLSGTVSGPGGSGATVKLTGAATASTTADSNGNFTFTGLANGSYTVTPSKTGFTYTPASQAVTVSNANVTGVSFSTVSYSLSGNVSGPGGSGATVTLTGTASASTTADTSGNYSFTGLVNGSYTVTPSKTGFTFTPASTTTSISSANLTGVNFATVTYTISGTVTGPGASGATITLTGSATGSTTTNSSGSYTLTGVAPGSYTVTPTLSGYGFTPSSQAVTVTNANVSAVNFSTAVATYTLSGTISGVGGPGATVTLSGTSAGSATADNAGNFSFTGLTNGSYTLTPSNTGYTFSPASQPATINGVSVTGMSFSSFQVCPCTLWPSTTVPANPSANDPSAIEVGVRFTSDVAGFITGLQFYKGSGNTGTHIGNLWSNTGTLLATATFTNETASGWQSVSFASPVAVAANTTYVASYHTTAGNYAADQSYFAGGAYNNPPLHAIQDGTSNGSNGIFLYGNSAFPTGTYLSTNYYVDVTFTSAGAYSISGTISGTGGSGATVSLTGTSTAVTTADANGNYTFTGLNNGTYTVSPTKTGYNFTPSSQGTTINGANITALNFSTATYTLSGTISGAGGVNAAVALTGSATASTTANASGAYSFTGLTGGTYTVTPSLTGFTYTPPNQSVTISNASATTVNFSSASVPTYTVSGTITGSVVSGVTLQLTGSATASTTTNTSGAYSFTVAAGSYTITPSSTGYQFSPGSQAVTVTSAAVSGVNFTSSVATYTLQGTISGAGGSGATVTLSGPVAGSTTADTSGNFTFTGLTNGAYSITPSKTGYSFSPSAQAATVSNANVTGMSFSSFAACPCSIWTSTTTPGNLASDPNQTELGVRFTSDVAGVITGIRFYKGTTNTGTHIAHLWNNSGTLLATATFSGETASGWQQVSFSTPVAITANTVYVASYNTSSGNYSYDQNYFASAAYNNAPLHAIQDGTSSGSNGIFLYGTSAFPTGTYLSTNYYVDVVFNTAESISGTISGPGGPGATVNLTGAATQSVTADSSGNYTFTGLANGSYTVTPSHTGFTFTPASQAVTLNNANGTANFSTVTYTLSGTISGTGGNGATVNLTGAATATTTANTSGAYSFTGLANGSYTVTPSHTGYGFTPTSQNATVNGANVTGINFTAGVPTYSISGTVSMPGGNGATVSVTGTSTASATADANGNYTISGLANGSYTVTPTKTGYTFTPTNQAVTISSANVTAINFTTISYSISGTISGAGGASATVNLTGAATATATADANGNFSFSGLGNGAYTVTPSKSGYAFTPPSQAVTISSASVTGVSFSSATATGFSISGTISNAGGNGATVTLTGAASATTTASATGTYTFSNLANGSYTVTPSKTGYIFTPASTAVTVNGANATANFTSTAQLAIDKTVSTDRTTNSTSLVSPAVTTSSANELLLAFVSTDATGAGITVTQMTGGSLTWTLVKRTNTQLGTSEIWRAFSATTVSNATVTATLSQSVPASITVVTLTGVDTTGTGGSGAIGATGTGNSAKGAPTASLTTTRNNSWVFGVGNDYDKASARTVGSGQTMVHQDVATSNGDTYWVQRQTNTTPTSGTSVTINDTAPTGDRYNLSTCEVLPAQ